MKNKIFFLGSLCLVLALGLGFTACEEEESAAIGKADAKFERVVGPNSGGRTATLSPIFAVSWKAVDDASDYQVIVQTQNSDTSGRSWETAILAAGTTYDSIVQNWETRYDKDQSTSGSPVKITGLGRADWGAMVDFRDYLDSNIGNGGFGRMGVMAVPFRTNKEPSIVWSEYYDFWLSDLPGTPLAKLP